MKYYPRKNKSIYIREINENTYETMQDYIVDTMILNNAYDEVYTIWNKRKDHSNEVDQ